MIPYNSNASFREAFDPRTRKPSLRGEYVFSAVVGMARCAVPTRVVAGGTNERATLAFAGVAPLHAARTSQRDVPTMLNTYGGKNQVAGDPISMTHRRAAVLVGLLWCLALLSVVVIGVLHTASMDLRVVKNYGDKIQAHYLALAGIEKAKALLYQDAIKRRRSAQNHSGELYDAPEQFRDVRLGRGQFRVFRQGRRDEVSNIIFGVIDEESR